MQKSTIKRTIPLVLFTAAVAFMFDASHAKAESHIKVSSGTRSAVDGSITASEVVRRSQFWIDNPVTYSQSTYYPDADGRLYRGDCSGFVSLSWHLSRSYTTATLPEVTSPIAKDQLRTGDALLAFDAHPETDGRQGHVILFVRWTDSSHTAYVGREQTSTAPGPLGTVERVVPYPYSASFGSMTPTKYPQTWQPVRYRGLRVWLTQP